MLARLGKLSSDLVYKKGNSLLKENIGTRILVFFSVCVQLFMVINNTIVPFLSIFHSFCFYSLVCNKV